MARGGSVTTAANDLAHRRDGELEGGGGGDPVVGGEEEGGSMIAET